jgi:UDP-GlcNAc:undecaprenyl-phosphate GlcNAc-1-phosphate transferase
MFDALFNFLTALVICVVVIKALKPLSRRLGWLDAPDDRKQHQQPTPPVGGFGVLIAILLPALVLFDLNPLTFWFFIGAILLVVLGALDDRFDLNWRLRLAVHVLVGLILVYGADLRAAHVGPLFGFGDIELGWLSVPFTLFITVALINALNMYDGIDGQVGMVTLAVFSMFVCVAVYSGAMGIAASLFLPIGALCGFLCFNLRRPGQPHARVFLGDAGSGLIGYTVAYVIFLLTQNPQHPVSPILGPYLLAPPIIDSITVVAHRMRRGRSPFAAGRDHAHHLMLDAGFDVGQVVRLMTILTCMGGLFGAVCMIIDVPAPVMVMVYIVAVFAWFWVTETHERAMQYLQHLHRWVFRI